MHKRLLALFTSISLISMTAATFAMDEPDNPQKQLTLQAPQGMAYGAEDHDHVQKLIHLTKLTVSSLSTPCFIITDQVADHLTNLTNSTLWSNNQISDQG